MSVIDMSITVHRGIGATDRAVRESLRADGFGVLTEVDVQQTLRAKAGAQIEPYLILGVCNPTLAHEALDVDRQVGVLLPCTVVIRALDADNTIVEMQDPALLASLTGRPELQPIAEEATHRLREALGRLAADDA